LIARNSSGTGVDQRFCGIFRYRVRIPRDADQRSELMSITIPK
jgi:hypothetical protein